MRFDLPQPVTQAIARLNARGYEAYAVGGCVRDLLRGEAPHDYDICVSCTPQQTHACFANERVIDTGIQHGTVTVLLGGMPLEITTYRTDGPYTDGRHPDRVQFTASLSEDLQRRDFTVNAMAYHPDRGVVDLFGGQQDLSDHVIRCVGEPRKRFTEDALRILRALRFAARLQFSIDEATALAMRALKDRLSLVSRERISAELRGILTAPGGAALLADFFDVLQAALPDLPASCAASGIEALGRLRAPDAILALAALLHRCDDGSLNACLASLKLPKAAETQARQLVEHARPPFAANDTALILSQLGHEQLTRLLSLLQATSALSAQEAADRAARAQAALDAHLPLSLRELALSGNDLACLGYAGPAIGEALNDALRAVLHRELKNDRDALLAWAQKRRAL